MFIVFGVTDFDGEFYGKGKTLESAIQDLHGIAEDPITIREYYRAEPIKVEKTVTYKIVE